jgi:hypothetical protein
MACAWTGTETCLSRYIGAVAFAVFSSDGKLIRTVELPALHHSNLAISPDGKFVFVTAVYDTPGGGSRGEILKVPNSTFE